MPAGNILLAAKGVFEVGGALLPGQAGLRWCVAQALQPVTVQRQP
jgi:hypothetical protein